jgi:hypothetical protein
MENQRAKRIEVLHSTASPISDGLHTTCAYVILEYFVSVSLVPDSTKEGDAGTGMLARHGGIDDACARPATHSHKNRGGERL